MSEDKFTDDDHKALVALLKKYGETELDQWERWKFKTKYGYVFVEMTRKEGESPDSWNEF